MPKNSKTSTKKPAPNYETLKAELDTIMAELQREDLGVDAALRHYQRGLDLVRRMEDYLKTAENKIIELKAKPGR
jgi:exodeoxyribonuclease VII small subunit